VTDPAAGPLRPRLRDCGRTTLVALAVIVLAGLAVRVYAALNPIDDPGPDATAYKSLSRALFETGRYGTGDQAQATDWSPGAPLLFAAVYKLAGSSDPRLAMLAEALLGTLTIVVVFLLALRLAGRLAGLLAAFFVAGYGTFIDNTAQLLSEPLAAFLLPTGLLAWLWANERGRWWAWLAPGLCFGALSLTRPEYLPFAALFAGLAAVVTWRRRGIAMGLAAGAVALLASVAVVTPWTVRNYHVLGKVVPVSTGGGKALFVATYLPGGGRQVPTKQILMRRYLDMSRAEAAKKWPDQEMAPLLDRVARKYPELPRDAALARIGRENLRMYLKERPLAYGRMVARKAYNVWRRGSSPLMNHLPLIVWQQVLLLSAIAGFVLLVRRRRWEALLLAIPPVGVTLLGAILLAVPRRNVPLMPLICVLAASAMAIAVAALRNRRSGPPASEPAEPTAILPRARWSSQPSESSASASRPA